MNRPTIDVDDLLDLADEAVSAGDQSQAIAILRKATTIAPLRRDIKNRLAIVLEGTPVSPKPVSRARSLKNFAIEEDVNAHELEQQLDSADIGRESISQIARRAFDAAATQKAKAGDATRKLTNLLQTGIGNWKSSLAAAAATPSKKSHSQETYVPESISQSSVFTPEEELKQYLERAAADDSAMPDELEELIDEGSVTDETTARMAKPSATSRKAARSKPSSKVSKRPTDVEDVLAAGIGGFIEALSRMNKTKLLYASVYVSLVALFGFACFDVSNKFPALSAETYPNISAASVGISVASTTQMSSTEAIEKAQSLVKSGSHDDAIALLESQLAQGSLLHNRDVFRAELASLLNSRAEVYLTENQLTKSVEAYRKALSHLPGDPRLQLRLANALYYHGVMGTSSDVSRKESLEEAGTILNSIIRDDSQSIQAHRLQALLFEAQNKNSFARTSWQKVKALAPAGSAILDEAKTHLK